MKRLIEYLKPAPHETWLVLCGDLTIYALVALTISLLTY